ncbi:hypothetical protein CG405_03065 [Gardnerella vaginalis]|uniref:Uncharacterized protein n=1 Tax=Gardnerella vaginalis TaxID=2702 RepID=A0A3E2CDF8_GARVA|nr:hypothetical protein CG405_03065 [Gardnerella vaginalis]
MQVIFYLYLYVLWGEYGVGCVSTLARFKCANVFACVCVFSPAFVVVFAQMINKLGKIFL